MSHGRGRWTALTRVFSRRALRPRCSRFGGLGCKCLLESGGREGDGQHEGAGRGGQPAQMGRVGHAELQGERATACGRVCERGRAPSGTGGGRCQGACGCPSSPSPGPRRRERESVNTCNEQNRPVQRDTRLERTCRQGVRPSPTGTRRRPCSPSLQRAVASFKPRQPCREAPTCARCLPGGRQELWKNLSLVGRSQVREGKEFASQFNKCGF